LYIIRNHKESGHYNSVAKLQTNKNIKEKKRKTKANKEQPKKE
jgi:hypothetical protein